MDAPTADETPREPKVLDAIEAAWADSFPGDPARRHGEGGWVYFNPDDGRYLVLRAPPGVRRTINLGSPDAVDGYDVVARFHTHPSPAAAGFEVGPSQKDVLDDQAVGLPGFVRSELGIHRSGPARRRGGLTGPLNTPVPEDEE